MANTQTAAKPRPVEVAGTFLARYADWILGIGVLGLVVTLITPISPVILDVLLAFNLMTSMLLLLVTLNSKSAHELSTFPSILLFTTLFRLGLNVASTRLILTHGEAGHIIKAFGDYVGGDSKKRLLGFAAELEGANAAKYELEYAVRVKGLSKPLTAKNGAICGTDQKTGKTIEAISITLRKK